MPTGINPGDQLVVMLILAIVFLVVLIIDVIILCYWLSFKLKEASYRQAYGPVITFPPRESGWSSEAVEPFIPTAPEKPSGSQDSSADENSFSTTVSAAPSREDHGDETTSIPVYAAPEFDFLPPETPPVANSPNAETPDAEPPNAETPDAPKDLYPTAIEDMLEDTRPIDPALISAIGGLRSPFASTWSLVHPFLGIQAVIAVVTILSILALIPSIISSGQGAMSTPYGLLVIIASLFIQNAGFVAVTGFLLKSYGTSLGRVGLKIPSRREVALGLVLGCALCLASMGLEWMLNMGATHLVSKHFADRMGKLNDSISAGGMFEQIRSIPLQIGFILGGAVAAPIGEEVFFRGLLYNSLKKRWGVSTGVILSGICFALIHFAPLSVIVIIPVGCLLALAYERTKSLWVTILMHAVNNGVQFVLAMHSMNHHAGH